MTRCGPDWAIFERHFSNFLSKVAQISVEFWGYLKKIMLYVKTTFSAFWATFVNQIGLLQIPPSGHTVLPRENAIVFVLTFDPKLFHSALDLGTFEADREGGKDEDADEENLSGVNLQKSAELEQLRLELGPQPQSCLVACSFALK